MRLSRLATITVALAVIAVPLTNAQASTPDPAAKDARASSADRAEATAALRHAQRLMAGYRHQSPTMALARLHRVYDSLSASQREVADRLFQRPTDDPDPEGDGWSVDEATPLCDENLCLHYVATTADAPPSQAWAQLTFETLQDVWQYEVDTLGYRAPAPDGTRGGDARFDFYLGDNLGGDGYYGYCNQEAKVPGQDFRRQSFCVLDNDFVEFGNQPVDSLRVTAAHEFLHAIQFNYDSEEDGWIGEATAAWIEEQYADDVNDNLQYLEDGQLGKPSWSLDRYGSFEHYGQWIFFEAMSDAYGIDVVRRLWERMDATKGMKDEYSTQAIKNFLATQGVSFTDFYADFTSGNLIPASTYTEGSLSPYKPAPIRPKWTIRRGSTTGKQKVVLNHLTSANIQFQPRNIPSTGKLRIKVNAPNKVTAPAADLWVFMKSGAIKGYRISLNASGDGAASVKFSSSAVSRVTLTLTNASTRMTNCYNGSNYACGGKGVDDKQLFVYTASG